ncbi:MAG: hypothetical protein L0Y54_08335 [Sporichthyaceae bacterium]|nr:hypothetical protein [Sporichthyaceae bacterium]
MISGPVYCLREEVKAALDTAETARNNTQVDRAIESASRAIDGGRQIGGLLRRRFYPELATRYFDWPNHSYARPWRLWLGPDELISADLVVAGGVTIAGSDYFLEPANSGPPFTRIEIDLSSASAFAPATGTHQRAIAITGLYGFNADEAPAGALAEALDSTETDVDVTDSSPLGAGSIIKVDSERLLVTGRSMLDTGQSSSALTASSADVAITGISAGTIKVGEVLLVDSERMLAVDAAGTTITVKRAWDGTALAAHSGGADIYAPRTLTVTRGALGTTAASHNTATAVTRHLVPPLVRDLCIAEAINQLQLETAGYARVIGEGDNAREGTGRSLFDLRKAAAAAYGRQARLAAVLWPPRSSCTRRSTSAARGSRAPAEPIRSCAGFSPTRRSGSPRSAPPRSAPGSASRPSTRPASSPARSSPGTSPRAAPCSPSTRRCCAARGWRAPASATPPPGSRVTARSG